jgi:acyl-CoA dehydrogenase
VSGLQRELTDLVADVVTSSTPEALWPRLRDLGLHRIGVAEDRGGAGGSLEDLTIVVEALAGHAASVPLGDVATAEWLLSHDSPLDDPQSSLTTVALADLPGPTDGTLTAEVPHVPWARDADRIVLCRPAGAPLVVEPRGPGVVVRPGENLAGEPLDSVLLTGAPVVTLEAAPTWQHVGTRLALLRSAAVLGAAHGAFRLTKDYVAQREQFGAPLLAIPAVAANLARMRVQLVQADTALALARDGSGGSPSPTAVAIARFITATAATEIAQLAHQLHGAIGVTAEYPLHRFTRRLWAWRDGVAAEGDWARSLGSRAAEIGEAGLWDVLTAPHA